MITFYARLNLSQNTKELSFLGFFSHCCISNCAFVRKKVQQDMMACATDVVDVDIGVRSKGTFLLAFFASTVSIPCCSCQGRLRAIPH